MFKLSPSQNIFTFYFIIFHHTHVLPPTTIDLSDGTLNALKGLPE